MRLRPRDRVVIEARESCADLIDVMVQPVVREQAGLRLSSVMYVHEPFIVTSFGRARDQSCAASTCAWVLP